MQCFESSWMSRGSLTVQPGEKPIRSEYLFAVVGAGVTETGGVGMSAPKEYAVGGIVVPTTDGRIGITEIGVRPDGKNVDMVGNPDGITGDVTDGDVLSHISKLTWVR